MEEDLLFILAKVQYVSQSLTEEGRWITMLTCVTLLI